MKKKKIYLAVAAIALILAVAIVAGVVLGNGLKVLQPIDKTIYASSPDDDWKVVTKGNIILSSDNIELVFDAATTHFTVENKITGVLLNSISDTDTSSLLATEVPKYTSELVVEYFDSQFMKSSLNSSKNSVDFGNAVVKVSPDNSAIRVYYTLRKDEFKSFAPEVVTEAVYNEYLKPNNKTYYLRQFETWYTLYESADNDAATKEMKSKYPALNKQNLWILNDKVSDNGYKEITKVMSNGGYTEEMYIEDAKKLGIEASEAGMSVGFVIPVEYKVTEDGFTAQVLNDKFQSESSKFAATKISLLPNFGASSVNTDGYFLIPDGSGAVVNIAEKPGISHEMTVYGVNGSITNDLTTQLAQNTYFPVFGYNRGENGFFAVIEGADEESYVHIDTYGGNSVQSDIYARFNLTNYDVTDIQAAASVPVYNLYSKNVVTELPKVRYFLLDEENNSYSSMARIYRDYLIENGTLGERFEGNSDIPFYLDVTGYYTANETIMGVPYVNNKVISTVSGTTEAVNKLSSLGVNNINVRFKAYGNSGVFQDVADEFEIIKEVGTVDQLKTLATSLKGQNGMLYLEHNVGMIYKDTLFDVFTKQIHASRTLTHITAINGNYNMVTREKDDLYWKYYLLSPMYFSDLTTRFSNTFNKKVGAGADFGYSWSGYGSKIWSDFDDVNPIDRTISQRYIDQAMNIASKTFADMITDGGNIYAVKDVSAILNMPNSDSLYDFASYKVPFMQMVLHGYKDYSSAPFNLAANGTTNKLASIECGANVYYSCFTEPDDIMKQFDDASIQFPTGITGIYDRIAADYKEFNNIFKNLRSQLIVEHECLERELFCTTYEDGTKIIVNYNIYDCEAYGNTVEASNYIVIGSNGEVLING